MHTSAGKLVIVYLPFHIQLSLLKWKCSPCQVQTKTEGLKATVISVNCKEAIILRHLLLWTDINKRTAGSGYIKKIARKKINKQTISKNTLVNSTHLKWASKMMLIARLTLLLPRQKKLVCFFLFFSQYSTRVRLVANHSCSFSRDCWGSSRAIKEREQHDYPVLQTSATLWRKRKGQMRRGEVLTWK